MRTQIKYYEYYEPGSDLHINQKLGLVNSRSRSLRGYFLLITNIKKIHIQNPVAKTKKIKKIIQGSTFFYPSESKGRFFLLLELFCLLFFYSLNFLTFHIVKNGSKNTMSDWASNTANSSLGHFYKVQIKFYKAVSSSRKTAGSDPQTYSRFTVL